MPALRRIEGGGAGGLDPRRARLNRIHNVAILGLFACLVGFAVVGFFSLMVQVAGPLLVAERVALAGLAVGAVAFVVTIYMVAMMFDSDPRTRRELKRLGLDD